LAAPPVIILWRMMGCAKLLLRNGHTVTEKIFYQLLAVHRAAIDAALTARGNHSKKEGR